MERRECLRKAPEERDGLKQTLKSRSGSMKWVPMEVRGISGRAVWIRSRRTGEAFGRLGPPWNDEVEMLPNEHYKGNPALQEWGQTQETLCVGKCEKCVILRMLPKMAEQGRTGNITLNLKEPGNASSIPKPLGTTPGKPRYLPGANEQCLYKSADL